jgi:hypothetical protein
VLNALQARGKGVAVAAEKDATLRMDLFSATQKLMSHKRLPWTEAEDLVFVDHHMVPLMVQEAYLTASRSLEEAVAASDRSSEGDLIQRRLFSSQDWSLLPSVVAGTVSVAKMVSGPAPFQIFPSWLGKHSKRLKHRRMLTTLRHGGRFGTDTNLLDSLSLLRARLFKGASAPLIVDELVSLGMTRDDMLETLVETAFSDEPTVLDSKLKGGITREWKKRGLDLETITHSTAEDAIDSDDEEYAVDYLA